MIKLEHFLVVIFGILVPEIVGETIFADMKFENSVSLTENYKLHWKLEKDNIILKIEAGTLGYVGIGFSPFENPRSMTGSDIIVGGVADDKTGYVLDLYATRNTVPSADSNTVKLLYANEKDGHTTVIFERKLAAEDAKDKAITPGKSGIIWAYGQQDVVGEIMPKNYHKRNRGSATIDFFQQKSKEPVETEKTSDDTDEETHADHTSSCPGRVVTHHHTDEHEIMPHYIYLDKESDVFLRWGIDGKNITFEMSAQTKGWIALGFTPGHDMTDADITMMGVNSDGPYVFDCFSLYNTAPTVDNSQDVEIVGHMENGTHTTIKFTRMISSSNEEDRTIEKNNIYVIWAIGLYDIVDKPGSVNYHFNRRGSIILNLLHEEETENSVDVTDDEKTHGDEETTDGEGEKADSDDETTHDERETEDESTHADDDKSGSDHMTGTVALGNGKVILQWSIAAPHIYIQLSAPTTGWIGFGISIDGSMVDADITISGLKDGKPYVFDMHGFPYENTVPVLDKYQDVQIFGANEYESRTVVLLQRPIIANRTERGADRTIKKGKIGVIWAYGTDDIDEYPRYRNYHYQNRGHKRVKFMPKEKKERPADTTSSTGQKSTKSEPTSTSMPEKSEMNLFENGKHVTLDVMKKVDLYWTYNNNYIVFKITAPTKGWVGFGISSRPGMAGADIVIAGVRSTRPYVMDLHGRPGKNGSPKTDAQQDVMILKYSEIGKMTSVTFYRKIDTMDMNDKVITGDNVYVIWAFGKADIAMKPRRYYHHKNRGSMKVKLIDGPGNLPMSYKFAPAETVVARIK